MADNYLQRSHRQDDSRLVSDDPLMELSRIMGTPQQDESADDFALDLERELMGGLDEQAASQSARQVPDHGQPAEDDQFAAQDFQESIERELAASEPSYDHQEAPAEPAATYEEPDYADYEPGVSYTDNEAGEGVAAAAQYEERPAVAAPSPSLEDELQTLLAGSAQPVVQRSANASWGYGSQTQVVGRTEPAPTISRTTSYQQPAPQPSHAPEPAAYHAPVQEAAAYEATEEQAQDDFDTDELIAAFDDFEVPSEIEEEPAAVASEPVFPRYHEQIEVPVAAPVASAPRLPEVHDLSDYADELDRAASSIDAAAPDVDTVAVTENRVDYTEALDLPAVHYEDDTLEHNGLGELETEFAEVFGSIEAEDQRASHAVAEEPAKAAPEKDEFADIFADVFGNEAEQNRYNPAGFAAAAGAAAVGMAAASAQQNRPAVQAAYQHGPEEDNDFGYDPRQNDVDIATTPYGQKPSKGRSSLFVPGVAAAVVLLAVAGAVAYKWTGGSGGEPVVIMADKTPIKVQPETTSTATVPNQDKAVYDKGATAAPEAPKQDQLVTTQEQPADLSADEDEGDQATAPIDGKVEARVDPAQQDVAANDQPAERNGAIAPRKVQTMVVKPDGTMVASIPEADEPLNAGPAAAPAERPMAPAPVTANAPAAPAASSNDEIGSLVQDNQPATPAQPAAPEPAPAKTVKAPAAGKLPAKAVETKKITQETVASVAPKNVPTVDSRPADQPLDIVDRVPPKNAAGQQVASAAPAAGSYLIQIASQPNVEGAQKTYASLSQKYASVIGGRGVDIKQAEIAGKGTFFRVRIPAGSKNDAINLCSKYKSAGGSCFVTQ
jgi:SPOR domain